MAATFWTIVISCEAAIAVMVALIVTHAADVNIWLSLPIALGVLVLIQYLIVGVSILASRALTRPAHAMRIDWPAWRAALTEPLHFGLAQLAMIAEPWSPPDVRSAEAGSRPVLLVHGLACNRGVWQWLLPRLRLAGFAHIHTVNLQSMHADIDRLASVLEREVRKIHDAHGGARVTIVAHSMGGLAARTVLRTLGPEVVRHLITVATPHHGAALARLLSWPAARQMNLESSWLAGLNAPQAAGRARVPVTSIYSLDDNLVSPACSARLEGATLREMRGLGHFGLLVSARALDGLVSTIEEAA